MKKKRPKVLERCTIRGTDKIVTVGDCVLMQSTRCASKPRVARVEKIKQGFTNNVSVYLRWYYRPEETIGGRREFHGAKELFLSDHYDLQSADNIVGKCVVHNFKNYVNLDNVGDEDYYCRFQYNAATGAFTPGHVDVYCKCNMPYNPDKLMVQCERGKDWYHPACVGMTIEEARKLEHFVCYECSSDDDMKKPQTTFPSSPGSDSKDFHLSKMTETSTFPATANDTPEGSISQDVIAIVEILEKMLKTNTDNIMQFLEGISSRVSQLESYCYSLDKSIGEMSSELKSDHEEADSKLKSLEKQLQDVHRSVQILRDKQELAETQKELAKLRKESSSSSHSHSNEEKSSPSATNKRTDDASVTSSDTHNQQLALALPHQVTFQQQPVAPPSQAPTPNVTQATQQPCYYMLPTHLPNHPVVARLPQNHQYLPYDPPYQNPQSTSSPYQVTQSPPVHQFSQYQQLQQWPQQLSQQVQPLQPPSMHFQMRPPSVYAYAPYLTSQATTPLPTDTLPNSIPIQMLYSGGIPPPRTKTTHGDPMPYGYTGTSRTVPQPPPQQIKAPFAAQQADLYRTSGAHATRPPSSSYMTYEGEGGRAHYSPQPSYFAQGGYPPPSASLQNPAPQNLMVRNPSQPQFIHNHPYNELIQRLVSMGFRGDHVASIIQRMEESGQPVDFNSLLDQLNVHSSS